MTDFPFHTATDLDKPVCIPFARVLEALEKGTIQNEHGLMRWGSNYTFLVSVTYEDTNFLAIYKPRMGERPLWDFPDGTLCNREVATFLTSEALGWRMVPPTVLREGPRGIGSVQAFINHDPNQHYFTFDESMIAQLQRLAALDAVVNNADRKGGHCLPDPNDHLWGIDHGLTFNTSYKLRTVIWDFAGKSVPEEILKDVGVFCEKLDNSASEYASQMDNLLRGSEMKALKKRVRRMLTSKTYPRPGPGPNRPWPPV